MDNEVFWHTNGDPIPVEYVSTPILKNGNPNGAVIVFRDNTHAAKANAFGNKPTSPLNNCKPLINLF